MIKRLSLALIMLLLVFGAAVNLQASSTPKINGPDLIQKEQYQVLTLSDILALYSSDLGGVSIQSDGFTGNGATLGTYEIELIASDGTQQALKTIEVQVLSSIGYKVRAVTDKVNIHISKTYELHPIDIVQVHSKTGLFTLNSTSQYQILANEYSANHDSPGNYLFEYMIMDASGLNKHISCHITVYESERLESPIIVIPAKPGVFDHIAKLLNTAITLGVVGILVFLGFKLFRKGRKTK